LFEQGSLQFRANQAVRYFMGLGFIEFPVNRGAKLYTKDELGQTPLSISLSILTKEEAGVRRPQIPCGYRGEAAQFFAKLGATPLNKSADNIVLQRDGSWPRRDAD
jgi:hypothetical protein